MIKTLKQFWEGLSVWERTVIIKKNHLWDGLRDFRYREIPEDIKPILKREMKLKQAQKRF